MEVLSHQSLFAFMPWRQQSGGDGCYGMIPKTLLAGHRPRRGGRPFISVYPIVWSTRAAVAELVWRETLA